MLCEDSTTKQATGVARRIHAALATPISWAQASPDQTRQPGRPGSTRLSASIGIATTSDPTSSAHQLLHDADSAMYLAKPT